MRTEALDIQTSGHQKEIKVCILKCIILTDN